MTYPDYLRVGPPAEGLEPLLTAENLAVVAEAIEMSVGGKVVSELVLGTSEQPPPDRVAERAAQHGASGLQARTLVRKKTLDARCPNFLVGRPRERNQRRWSEGKRRPFCTSLPSAT